MRSWKGRPMMKRAGLQQKILRELEEMMVSHKVLKVEDSAAGKKGNFDQMLADGANAQNNAAGTVPGNAVVCMPATNLNSGMDLGNVTPAGAGGVKMRSNPSGVSPVVAPATMVGHEGIMPDQWIQDERELKRQKRKLSNRESARRSRLTCTLHIQTHVN
ncbi:hypothetical protein F0562_003812 [Nyssa sinensis]|uniref:BZIP domain-containing protein n=1 Tax=Nyssa sinensis TaxID=561372 RepID=A0A5J5BXG8_9ASTE|nr:hypothetical protein F0562_003812 [Nyssa sinensis]